MPNMDGLELLRRIRSAPQWNNLTVIMVTTEGSQARVQEAVALGASGYVHKPFTTDLAEAEALKGTSRGLLATDAPT